MTKLKTVGKYVIESEKCNSVTPDWVSSSVLVLTAIGFGVFAYFFDSIKTDPDLVLGLFFLIIVMIFLITAGLACIFEGCGIDVRLIDSYNNGFIISRRSFKMSGNLEDDAARLEKLVDKYEKEANGLTKREEMMKEYSKMKNDECCDAYRKVIEKVK